MGRWSLARTLGATISAAILHQTEVIPSEAEEPASSTVTINLEVSDMILMRLLAHLLFFEELHRALMFLRCSQ